jgi:hypothetical protein
MGRTVDVGQASAVLSVLAAQASSWTRGVGFTNGQPNDEILYGVIYPAALRLLAHPRQLSMSESAGPETVDVRTGFNGFTINEQRVLGRYRVQAL